SAGSAIELHRGDEDEIDRTAANLGITLSRNESASVDDLPS
ncbi:hypothetical protein, partial [Nocardia pneumoniae]